jgi:hypothetical protein
MKISELQEHDVVYLTPGQTWVITSGAEVEGVTASFQARQQKDDGSWLDDQEFRFPAEFQIGVAHAWRTVQAPCLLCKETYPHRMDIAVASDPRGICGPCNGCTTATALANRQCST